jgi:hypothetical protein
MESAAVGSFEIVDQFSLSAALAEKSEEAEDDAQRRRVSIAATAE